MTVYPMTSGDSTSANDTDRFDKTARWIGDLDHPFYSDERNRFVWYEASAIGFQIMFLGTYFAAGAALWIAGSPALPFTAAMFAPTLLTAGVLKAYVARSDADYWPSGADLKRSRGLVVVAAIAFLLSGIVRAVMDIDSLGADASASESASDSFAGGFVPGLVAGLAAVIAVSIYKNRTAARREAAAELIEE